MAGSYELVQHGVLDDVPVLNRWHIGTPDEADNAEATAEAIAAYWVNIIAVDYKAVLPNEYEFGPAVCRGIIVSNGGSWTTDKAINFDAVGTFGDRAGDLLSNQNGPLVEWATNSEGISGIRQRVGRTFIPGITEDDASLDIVGAGALLTAIEVWAADMLANWTLGIGFDGVLRTLAQLDTQWFLDVAGYQVRKFIASQRRRRPKWDQFDG